MSIQKEIEDFLSQIHPEPLKIDRLLELFVKHVLETQQEDIPISIKKYRECLITNTLSFVNYLKSTNCSYLDEVTMSVLWGFRNEVLTQLKPNEKVVYLIALKSFLRWCYFEYYLDPEVTSSLYILKDNRDRPYIQDMDPCGFGLEEIF